MLMHRLCPDFSIPTKETGTRHRTAERTAKQTNELVISISQKKKYNHNIQRKFQICNRRHI